MRAIILCFEIDFSNKVFFYDSLRGGSVHEIEPNPSKDRAMQEGDNPSF
jgi:hypothetical protein